MRVLYSLNVIDESFMLFEFSSISTFTLLTRVSFSVCHFGLCNFLQPNNPLPISFTLSTLLLPRTLHSSPEYREKMAISVASLTSSFSSLSFSSQISQKPYALSLTHSKKISFSLTPKVPTLVVSASVAEAPAPEDFETREDLLKLVKSRLPGGFAAQPIFGTGRRKSAIARVVLQEGSGKIIINYRDAKVYTSLYLL